MRGRKPTPTALKLLAGNPGKRPLNAREPKLKMEARIPTPPPHLSVAAKTEWRRAVKHLHQAGLLTAVDRAALAAYCQAYGRWVKAEKELARKANGEIDLTPNGYPVQSAWLQIANRAQDDMRKWMVEFGMTPSSRSRVQVAQPEEPDELDLLFERTGKQVKVANG